MAAMSTTPDRTRYIVVTAIFTVLSFFGGLVKFGTPVGSVALDSWPGFFVAGYFSPMLGAIVGALGHLASAASAGFFLGWVHLVIAMLQAIWALVFGVILHRTDTLLGLITASIVAVVLNGVAAPYILAFVDPDQASLYKTLIPLLVLASVVNVLAAAVMLGYLRQVRTRGI